MLRFEVTCFWCPNWMACLAAASPNTCKLQDPKIFLCLGSPPKMGILVLAHVMGGRGINTVVLRTWLCVKGRSPGAHKR